MTPVASLTSVAAPFEPASAGCELVLVKVVVDANALPARNCFGGKICRARTNGRAGIWVALLEVRPQVSTRCLLPATRRGTGFRAGLRDMRGSARASADSQHA